jgi:threonine dehydrogenase-like Zn-dependent dehydrogenase
VADTVLALRLEGSRPVDEAGPPESLTGNLALAETPLAAPREGEVVVEPLAAGICGSDVHASLGAPNFSWVERPRTIGHEFCGRIVAFGPRTQREGGFQVGDRVTAVPQRGCGDPRCAGCGRGRWNMCRQKRILGFHRDGAFAERVVLEADRLVPVRPELSAAQAAVIEPLSVVAQALYGKCTVGAGMDVVVSGCGILGLLTAEVARAAGARVAITGLARDRDVRLALARERGFTTLVVSGDAPLHRQLAAGVRVGDGQRLGDAYEDGAVDVLLECSGAPAALAAAPLAVRSEGAICVIATYPQTVPFEATTFVRGGQSMAGVMGSCKGDFEKAQALLADGVVPVEAYVRVYPFRDALRAMADCMTARVAKAVLEIQGS